MQTLLTGVQCDRPSRQRPGTADGEPARVAGLRVAVPAGERRSLFLVRLLPLSAEPTPWRCAKAKSRLLEVVENAPDGFVVTGPDGRILTANAAFLDLAQLATEEQARGESLERWLGRPGVDLNVLIANLRQHGSVRLFATTLRGEYGATVEIEVSAVSAAQRRAALLRLHHPQCRPPPAT